MPGADKPARPAQAEPPAAETPPAPYPWLSVALGTAGAALLAAVSTLLMVQFMRSRVVDLREPTADLGESLTLTFRNQGIPASAIELHARHLHKARGALYFFTKIEVAVPEIVNEAGLERVVERALWGDGIVVSGIESEADARVLHLGLGPADIGEVVIRGTAPPRTATVTRQTESGTIARISNPVPELREWTPPLIDAAAGQPAPDAVAQRPARVAIIVDDGGYGGEPAEVILGLDRSLTLSILPYTPHGTELAQRASELGFEVMLHMPMENLSDTLRHEGQINVGMTREEMERLTQAALEQVPHAVGVNNHTGSKFTAEVDAMRPFLEWVQTTGLYFVDSGTTAKSIAYQAAHELGIPSASRTLFLDNIDEPAQIRARLLELADLARQQGEAIGICHFRPHTAGVLAEMLPQLKSMGIELVPASELVR